MGRLELSSGVDGGGISNLQYRLSVSSMKYLVAESRFDVVFCVARNEQFISLMSVEAPLSKRIVNVQIDEVLHSGSRASSRDMWRFPASSTSKCSTSADNMIVFGSFEMKEDVDFALADNGKSLALTGDDYLYYQVKFSDFF
ncbi:MAG: hypothetical protein MHMPM18_004953 [Marteilia pararefringens]